MSARTFFDERPPNAPFADVLRRDPLARAYRIRDLAWLRALRELQLGADDRVLDVGGANGVLLDRLHARWGARGVRSRRSSTSQSGRARSPSSCG